MNCFVLLLIYWAAAAGTAQATTLSEYLDPNTPLTSTGGYWYEITAWGARTHNCDNRPESMACMACASNVPDFAKEEHVAPIGVSNELWFTPETSAVCGMCLRVYMPPGNPSVGLAGTMPYYPNVAEPWAYSAKIEFDETMQMNYFTAIVVEWFDRNQSSATAITYPVMGRNTDTYGEWVIYTHPVPCPVNGHNLTFFFMDYSKPFPLPITGQNGWAASAPSSGAIPKDYSNSLCNNEFNQPCGQMTAPSASRAPLAAMKLKVGGYRVPVGAVVLEVSGNNYTMQRTGDNFWSPTGDYKKIDQQTMVTIYVQCSDGPAASWRTAQVVPGKCLCAYQDPGCVPCESQVQC